MNTSEYCKNNFDRFILLMTINELEIILQQGEGYNVEFKQSVSKEIAQEICAFANAAGGTLLIGIKDDNSVCGVTTDNVMRSRITDSLRAIDPHLDVEFGEINYHGKNLVYLVCGSGNKKPYALSGAIYVRSGPNSQKITAVDQMRDFFHRSGRVYFDEMPCRHFNITHDLDIKAFNSFLERAGIAGKHDHLTLLENLKLIENGKLKNGAVLFFGKDVQSFFEKATVRCVHYKGMDKRYIIDDKTLRGNLLQQYDAAIQYVQSKLNLSYDIESQGPGPRKEKYEIPEVVFKEALINALTHRDYYDKGATIMLEVFDNRFEITNPGDLVNGISREQFGKRSLSRNPLLFGLFERIDMVEQVGSGIPRMKDAMKDAGLQEPVFSVEGMFSVSLSRPVDFDKWFEQAKGTFGETRVRIIKLIKDNPAIAKVALAKAIGISSTAVDKHISNLRQLGILERIGGDRGGKWKIVMKSIQEQRGLVENS